MEFKARELGFIIVLAVLISSLGMCSFIQGRSGPDLSDAIENKAILLVHVAGAVQNPGVYQLEGGSRIFDAIRAAGGELEDADLHRLNLAAHIHDGQRIYVPRFLSDSQASEQTLVNLNTADQKTLETLPGIGPEIAKRIIDYRTKHGGFASIEEIINVDRIGPKTFENIKDLITVD
jgi:competence protein ComEA